MLIPVNAAGDCMVYPEDEVVAMVHRETGTIMYPGQDYMIEHGNLIGLTTAHRDMLSDAVPMHKSPDWVESFTFSGRLRLSKITKHQQAGRVFYLSDDQGRRFPMLASYYQSIEHRGVHVEGSWAFSKIGDFYCLVKDVNAK